MDAMGGEERTKRASGVVRLVLVFREAFDLRERAKAPVVGQDPDIGRCPFGKLADPIERRRRTLDVLDELLNCCPGNNPKAHAPTYHANRRFQGPPRGEAPPRWERLGGAHDTRTWWSAVRAAINEYVARFAVR